MNAMLVPIYTPQTESEAAVISSLLEAYNIPFYLRGGAFSKLYPGLQISHYNTQTFMTSTADAELAQALLADFLSQHEEISPAPPASISQKLRTLIEAVLCGWFVSGKRWRNKD